MKASLGLEAIGYETYRQTAELQKIMRKNPNNHIAINQMAFRIRASRLRPIPGDGVNRPWWVARITGASASRGWHYEYLRPSVDYTDANSKGTRGVMLYFILESGQVYHVQHTPSWGRTAQYFCRVTPQCDIEEINRDEVLRCLQNSNG